MYYNYDQLPYLTCRPPSTPSKRSLSCKSPSRLQKKLLSKTDSAIELVSERNRNSSWNGVPSLENHFQLPFSDQHWKSFTNQTITAPFSPIRLQSLVGVSHCDAISAAKNYQELKGAVWSFAFFCYSFLSFFGF